MYTREEFDPNEFIKTNFISKKFNQEWKKYSGGYYIGNCTDLYRRLMPTDCYDFYCKYTQDGENTYRQPNLSPHYRGRCECEIYEIAKKYYVDCGCPSDIDFELFVKNVYTHVIIETYYGQKSEEQLREFLNKSGYELKLLCGRDDAKLGIDAKIYKDKQLQFCLQIKPLSFFGQFRANYNYSLISDRKLEYERIIECEEMFKVPLYFSAYKNDYKLDEPKLWLSHSNGKIAFKYEELLDINTFLAKDLSQYTLRKI